MARHKKGKKKNKQQSPETNLVEEKVDFDPEIVLPQQRISETSDYEFENRMQEIDAKIQEFDNWIKQEKVRLKRDTEILDKVLKKK